MTFDFLFHSGKDQDEVVKEGWSWPAFFFTCIWAIFKGLWVHSAVTFFIFFGLGFIIGINESGALYLFGLSLLAMFVFGGNGNSWWKDSLLRQGFKIVTTISANTGEEAVGIYMSRLKTQKSQLMNQVNHPENQDGRVLNEIDNSRNESILNNLEVLEKLAQMRDKGILTEKEFIAQKEKLLGNG